jgi:REP element-mobilizing transposase RayT
MARPARIEFPGALYHVTSRGIERRDIFRDDADRRRFLTVLSEAVDRFGWIVSAYVLMSNHFHLLFELTLPTLSRGMQWLNSKYAQAFNKRYGRVGHLIQSRPDARLIQKETYFLNVLRYVVLNPVRANMVVKPDEYEWSSYRATAGLVDGPEWLSADEILKNFGEYRDVARQRYQRYVMDGIGGSAPWADLVGGIYLGTEEWVDRMREKVESRPRDCQHPRVQRCVDRWTMIDVLSSVAAGAGTVWTA